MPQPAHLDPGPFHLEGGTAAVLLIHGFTGAPPEMRLVGDYLHERGLTVAAPLLPGHGTTAQDLNRRSWGEWARHVDQAWQHLAERHAPVFAAGLSLGSLLASHLAANRPQLAGLILYSPALKVQERLIALSAVAKYVMGARAKGEPNLFDPDASQRLWHYDVDPVAAAHEVYKLTRVVRRALPSVTCPLLVIHSSGDEVIHPDSASLVYQVAGSRDKRLLTLTRSGHCITVDQEWQTVAAETWSFIEEHLPRGV